MLGQAHYKNYRVLSVRTCFLSNDEWPGGRVLSHAPVIRTTAKTASRPSTRSAARSIRMSWVLGWTCRHIKSQTVTISAMRKTKYNILPSIDLKYPILSCKSSRILSILAHTVATKSGWNPAQWDIQEGSGTIGVSHFGSLELVAR